MLRFSYLFNTRWRDKTVDMRHLSW